MHSGQNKNNKTKHPSFVPLFSVDLRPPRSYGLLGTGTSTFTQLLGSENIDLVECCFTSTETVGLLATGARDVHLDFHTPPELLNTSNTERNYVPHPTPFAKTGGRGRGVSFHEYSPKLLVCNPASLHSSIAVTVLQCVTVNPSLRDAEIKVPSVENPELTNRPLKNKNGS